MHWGRSTSRWPTPERVERGELPFAWLEPEDIANGALYLAPDEGRYLTGMANDMNAGKSANCSA